MAGLFCDDLFPHVDFPTDYCPERVHFAGNLVNYYTEGVWLDMTKKGRSVGAERRRTVFRFPMAEMRRPSYYVLRFSTLWDEPILCCREGNP
jgi:hypothetical protein